MDKQFYLILIAITISIVSVVFSIGITYLQGVRRKNEKKEDDKLKWTMDKRIYDLREQLEMLNAKYSSISDSRKYVEGEIYSKTNYFTRDGATFLDSNHVLLDTGKNNELLVHNSFPDFSFFEGMAINLKDIKVNEKMIACLMPFNPDYDDIKYTIAEACMLREYTFRRSDDELIKNNNDLRKSIIKMILEARIVVAVLDGRNPNVYYEIGIAHSMGKLVLMVVKMNETPAFDVSPNKLITYKTKQELKMKLVEKFDAVRFEKYI